MLNISYTFLLKLSTNLITFTKIKNVYEVKKLIFTNIVPSTFSFKIMIVICHHNSNKELDDVSSVW